MQDQVQALRAPGHIVLLVEICRALDFHHVRQILSADPNHHMPAPEFTTMVRGWNLALALLLPHANGFKGVPFMDSTPHSIAAATAFLVRLGNITLLRESALMITHGMTDAEYDGDKIVLKGSGRMSTDHYLDRLDAERLRQLDQRIRSEAVTETIAARTADWTRIEPRMRHVLFPWKPKLERANGPMIGYGAEGDIDNYFLDLVAEDTLRFRDDAGIHPESQIGGVSSECLVGVFMLLTSIYLKHIHFVDLGKKQHPEINYPMSLTIWKLPSDLINSIVVFTGMEESVISSALDLLTIRPTQCDYFLHERTPYLPMLIELSEGYLLAPVCSIFRNTLAAVRMFSESSSQQTAAALREPREGWMISDLCHLFMGARYVRIDRPTLLRRGDMDVTDIDAAVFDLTTGDLAIFQLKWQTFDTDEVRSQRSKAKNFVEQIDRWTEAVESWLKEFGWPTLSKLLRLNRDISSIRLFAIGRSAARFRSYGYSPRSTNVTACVWPQFVRLRYEIGPAERVFERIADEAARERELPVQLTPMPHEISVGGQVIKFVDLWNGYGDQAGPS